MKDILNLYKEEHKENVKHFIEGYNKIETNSQTWLEGQDYKELKFFVDLDFKTLTLEINPELDLSIKNEVVSLHKKIFNF